MSQRPWTKEETASLLARRNEPANQLAARYKRSPGAIRDKLRRLRAELNLVDRLVHDGHGDGLELAPVPPPETIFERHARTSKEQVLTAQLKEALKENAELRRQREAFEVIANHESIPYVGMEATTPGRTNLVMVAIASDWHIEERVDKGRVTYSENEYNPDIADARIRKFFDKIVWFKRHHEASGSIEVTELVLGLLGDLITGYIHEELLEGNFMSPIEAVLWLEPRLQAGINTLLENGFEQITIPCVPGNHGRTTPKMRISTSCENSYEWMMYNHLARLFKDEPRVKVVISKDNHQYVQVHDRLIHFAHFDDIKYQGGIGGLTIPLLRRVAAWNQGPQRADVHVGGHFHQRTDLDHVLVNSSLIGYNAYAQRIGAKPEPAQQLIFFMDEERGKCLAASLWCE